LSEQTFHVSRSITEPEPLGQLVISFWTKPVDAGSTRTPDAARLDAARQMAVDMVSGAIDSVMGESFDSSVVMGRMSNLDDLAAALASGQFSYMRSGLLPSDMNPQAAGGTPVWSQPVASRGGEGAEGAPASSPASAGYSARAHGAISPLRLVPPAAGANGEVSGMIMLDESGGSGGSGGGSGGGTAPSGGNDFYSGGHDELLDVPDNGVLWNDGLGDPEAVLSMVTAPSEAVSFNLSSGGGFTYEPPANWTGTDQFTYQLSNSVGTSQAVVTIQIVNAPPWAIDDGTYTVTTGEAVIVAPLGLLPPSLPSVPYTIEEGSLRYNDYDPDDDEFTLEAETDPQHGTLDFFDYDLDSDGQPDGGLVYTAYSGYAGTDEFTYRANDGIDESYLAARVFLNIFPRVDLDVAKINHNQKNGWLDDSWPDRLEDTQGAYVPMNDDDDDYDDGRTADKDQSDPITGEPVMIELESDLLPILLNPIDPVSVGGTYYLSATPGVRVFEHDDRTGKVNLWGEANVTYFDATVSRELYVEGTAAGVSAVGLWWWDGGWTPWCDGVKINVFDWTGPLNVPDHSEHLYTALWGEGPDSLWLAPIGGAVLDELNSAFDDDGSFADWMKIKWL
jgi:hypothetical protein